MSKSNPKARARYSDAIVNIIVDVLDKGGTDNDAAEAAGVNRNTFYTWKKKYPEFTARLDAAKAGFVQDKTEEVLDRLEECRSLAEDYVLRVFKGEVERVKTRTDGTGAIIFRDTEIVLPSDRMVERFLQLGAGEQNFNLTIGLAQPDDDDDLDDYEYSEISEPED